MTRTRDERSPRRARDMAFNLLLVVLAILAADLSLHVAARLSRPVERLLMAPWVREEMFVPDPQLGSRGNPFRADHDLNGYRNARALEQADVVALGDSHTYGVSVALEAAWPSHVAAETGLRVYDMALPGYGPAHGLVQLDRALALHPRLVILGLYFGNDLYDSFALSKINPQVSALMPAALRSATDAAEGKGLLRDKLEVLFRNAQGSRRTSPPVDRLSSFRAMVSEHSKLYAMARALAYELRRTNEVPDLLRKDFDRAVASLSKEDLRYCSVFQDGRWRTILTAPYRIRALDRGDPRIQAGLAITLDTLDQINARTSRAGSHLLVLLLPTKESVFALRVHGVDDHVDFARLVQAEAEVRTELKTFLSRHDILFVDPLPQLQASAAQPYFEDADGHPNEHGHRIIAAQLIAHVRRLGSAP